MTVDPRLTIGLPVYNGARYLSESLDSLLGQSFTDFEVLISDNASTDETENICRRYMGRDDRIRYVRQERNLGAAPNHNFVVEHARGEFFKWASHDDLYGRDLMLRCVEALDAHPDAVLSHARVGILEGADLVPKVLDYGMNTDSPHAPERFRSLLFDTGGQDFYGVIRTDVLRSTPLHDSYHVIAERPLMAEVCLHGRFYQVPEVLAFRRQHAERAGVTPTKRAQCAILDPRRANRWRHPLVRMQAEYLWAFVTAVRRGPISNSDRTECYRHVARYLTSRIRPIALKRVANMRPLAVGETMDIDLNAVIPGRQRESA